MPYRTPHHRARLTLRDGRGTAAVEFAILVPIFLLFIFGIFEFGRMFWTQNTLQFAADETGRYAMAHATATSSDLTSFLKSKVSSGVDPNQVAVAVVNDTTGGVKFVTVTADYTFSFLSAIIPYGPIQLTGRTRVPLGT